MWQVLGVARGFARGAAAYARHAARALAQGPRGTPSQGHATLERTLMNIAYVVDEFPIFS